MTHRSLNPLFILIVRGGAAAFTVVAVLFLLSRAAVPEGRLSTTTDFSGPAPFLSEPKPNARLGEPMESSNGSLLRPLVKSPVYLDVKPPADFDSITLDLAYETSGSPTVEIGALASSLDGSYDMRAAEHAGLDALAWPRVSSGDLTLLQRTARYASIDDFYRDPPPVGAVATFHATAALPYRLPDHVPSDTVRTTVVSLRGSHRFIAYVKDESLGFSFALQDMNRLVGSDPAVVTVERLGGDGIVLARTDLADDGNDTDDQKSVGLRTLAVSLANPAEGAYLVTVSTSSDVFIREFSSRQSKVVLQGTAYLGDFVGYSDRMTPVELWTDARRVVLRTAHVEGLQVMTVGGQEVALEEPHARYVMRLPGGRPTSVRSPRRDVIMESDGLWALSPDAWFDPLPFGIGYDTTADDLNRLGIDYVLMRYEAPIPDGVRHHAIAVFDTAKLDKFADDSYRLAIAAPGAEDGQAQVRLVSAKVTLRRTPLGWWDGLRRLFGLLPSSVSTSGPRVFAGESFGEAPE